MIHYRELVACVLAFVSLPGSAAPSTVSFDWFEYSGKDKVFEVPLPAGSYRNPILAGFYPDPSVTRAGDKFYLVNSTFAYFPGIPVFESSDLVHWRQVGNVLERPSQLKFDGLSVSRGVFAPAIHYHDGTFYVLNTLVDSGGNFIVTAKNAAGPWSDPIWLKEIDGIDPSIFVDADGSAYVLNNGSPEGRPLYEGHRAIWMQQFDLKSMKLTGPRKVMVNGGVDISKQPIWIEGPHLFKHEGWYYLTCAEGGTGINHSQVVLRSKTVWGPYEPYAGNPILTQRDLPNGRLNPVINTGHADLVEAPDGTWWATFLGSRPYDQTNYNTGRETYLLPVTWKEGWPVILDHAKTLPYVAAAPKLPNIHADAAPLTGNFKWRDEFDGPQLSDAWLQVRAPQHQWFDLKREAGRLIISPSAIGLDSLSNPSYLGRRQQHLTFEASTSMRVPENEGVAAGLAAFQNEKYWYFFGCRRVGETLQVFLEKKGGGEVKKVATVSVKPGAAIKLKITGGGRHYAFSYNADERDSRWTALVQNDDGSILSTEVAGGFVGATVGPYARAER